jgi:hypothetical protein
MRVLTDEDHIIDTSQRISEQVKTAQMLEDCCAAICPDGTMGGQARYARVWLHAAYN